MESSLLKHVEGICKKNGLVHCPPSRPHFKALAEVAIRSPLPELGQ
jgi:hypothetical protein